MALTVVQRILLYCLWFLRVTINADFIVSPTSQTVPIEEDAEFRCQHDSADILRWRVNGSLISLSNRPDGVQFGVADPVITLTIPAFLEYNGTEVVCVAQFDSGSPDQESNPPAILFVSVCNNAADLLHHTITDLSATNFTSPLSVYVMSGSIVVLKCNHSGADQIVWYINGTNLNDHSDLPGFRKSREGSTITLWITACNQYNSTMVQCIIFVNQFSEKTQPAVLQIQGPLAAVSNLTKVGSTLSWVAPFSLDLTNIDPDIVYCVDVYNITCGGRDLVSSDCHVTDTNYTAFSDGYLYEYIVTPRSNVEGAGNGTPRQWRDKLPTFSISSTKLSLPTSGSMGNYHVEITYTPDLPIPSSYTLSLEALDGLDSLSRVETTATVEQPNQLLLDVSGLESRRLWNCTIIIHAFGCRENSIISGIIISTHDFQNISISPFSGVVRVTGRYIEGSPATGVLVIVSSDSRSDSYYHIATRNGSDIQEATITSIAGGEYNVSVFVVEENGLPFERAATLPTHLSVERNNVECPSPSIYYFLESTSSGVCVNCTFRDTDASECVAVVYRNLMNIESSHKFTRSDDTASGCIEGVDLEVFQVGVVEGMYSFLLGFFAALFSCCYPH